MTKDEMEIGKWYKFSLYEEKYVGRFIRGSSINVETGDNELGFSCRKQSEKKGDASDLTFPEQHIRDIEPYDEENEYTEN